MTNTVIRRPIFLHFSCFSSTRSIGCTNKHLRTCVFVFVFISFLFGGCGKGPQSEESFQSFQGESTGQPESPHVLPADPEGFQVISQYGNTGRALISMYPGVRSATWLIRDVLNRFTGYFGARPVVMVAWTDQADREAQAIFGVTSDGVARRGVILSGIGAGQGVIGIAFALESNTGGMLDELVRVLSARLGGIYPGADYYLQRPEEHV